MNISDELQKLQTLREQGALNEEEFTAAKKRVLEDSGVSAKSGATRLPSALHQLTRSKSDRWISGVCGGLAAMTNIPTWSWRLLFVLALLLHGLGLVMYLLLWVFVPLERPQLMVIEDKRGEAKGDL
jgi:phage shock protein C